MRNKKKVLSIDEVQELAKRKEFNDTLNKAVSLMPEGCGIMFVEQGNPAMFEFRKMDTTAVVGTLEMVKSYIINNPIPEVSANDDNTVN